MNTNMEPKGRSSASVGLATAIASAIVGALLTVAGQPYFNAIFDSAKTPYVAKEVSSTQIDSLPDDVRKQISVVTTRYSLKHWSGGAASDITIFAKTSEEIPKSNVVVGQNSEPISFRTFTPTGFEIDVGSMRPKSSVSFEITHSPQIKIEWEERAKLGEIATQSELIHSNDRKYFEYFSTAVALAAAAAFVLVLFLLARKIVLTIVRIDTNDADVLSLTGRKRLAWFIVLLWGFGNITRSLSGSAIILSLSEAFFGVLMYVLLTNVQHLKLLLLQMKPGPEIRQLDNNVDA